VNLDKTVLLLKYSVWINIYVHAPIYNEVYILFLLCSVLKHSNDDFFCHSVILNICATLVRILASVHTHRLCHLVMKKTLLEDFTVFTHSGKGQVE